MKNWLGACVIAGMTLTTTVKADFAGFEIGGYQWKPDYKGNVQSNTPELAGTEINVRDDLGFTDGSHNVFWASLELPIPLIPNFKIVSSDIETKSDTILTQSPIIFNGQTYPLNENIVTTVDLSNIEYTFYYEILDNWIHLDAGLTIRQYDGELKLVSKTNAEINEFEEIDHTIPLIYLKGRLDLPLTGFFVDAVLNFVNYQEDSVSDIAIGVGYESEIGLGGKLGYRIFDLDIEEKDLITDLEFDGTYFSVFYHF